MKRLVTLEDFKDIYIKFHQRGLPFLFSKLSLNTYKRTQSAFNEKDISSSNFWIIPTLHARWNFLITGNENVNYETYITNNFFQEYDRLRMLSLGSGVCSHEIRLAELNPHWEIHCFDFSEELLKQAKVISDEKKLKNIFYHAENIVKYEFGKQSYDIVFFHASLHHFDHIEQFLEEKVNRTLKKNGHLIINEFVGKNRLQYSADQLKYINKAVNLIPKKYRKILGTTIYKNRYHGSGILRMVIADASECADSENILPAVHKNYRTIIEKKFGNNLMQSVFKDIAHHFLPDANGILSDEKKIILKNICDLEDEFLEENDSDMIFGIYQLIN